MMKNQFDAVIVDEKTIRNFLKAYGEGYKSKDHELAVAIYIKRLFEKQWNTECCLAFQLKESLKTVTGKPVVKNVKELQQIFRTLVIQDTPIDFLLLKGNPQKHSSQGYAFQLKRFGINIKENFKDELIQYIKHSIPSSFGNCGEVALILIIDLDENLNHQEKEELESKVDFSYFRERADMKTYPFKKIFFLGLSSNSLHLTEIWPGKQQFIASRQEVGLSAITNSNQNKANI